MAILGFPAFGSAQEAETAPEATPVPAPVAPELAAPAAPAARPRNTGANLRPLPRYVSLKGAEARARRGPGPDHRVDWVYQRPGLPMRVTAEFEHWRRVEDPEGAGGWMHYALLSTSRTVMVTDDLTELRARPEPGAAVLAKAEAGVVARLLECRIDWCRVSTEGTRGWLPKTAVWGVDATEILD